MPMACGGTTCARCAANFWTARRFVATTSRQSLSVPSDRACCHSVKWDARCGRESMLAHLEPPSQERLEELAGIVRERGVACTLG